MKAGKNNRKKNRKKKRRHICGVKTTTIGVIFLFSILSFSCVVFVLFPFLEPGMTGAVNDDVVVSLNLSSEITISSPSNVDLGTIYGISGGSLTSGDVVWSVTTSSSTGYFLNLKKNTLMNTNGGGAGKEINDYTEASSGVPDYGWGSVGSGNKEFGFSPSYGTDFVQKFKNDGASCNQAGGSITASHCWLGIPTGPTTESLAYSNSATGESGTETAIKLKVEIGANNYLEEGTYSSTLTATAGTN